MDDFVVCAYATQRTAYLEVAKTYLLPSLEKLKLPFIFTEVPNLGSWLANTSYKSVFAREMLRRTDKNIVLLDVDAQVLRQPLLLSEIPQGSNVAAHVLDRNSWYGTDYGSHRFEFLSGTLFLRNNDRTKFLVENWVAGCQKIGNWEQVVLQEVLRAEGESVYELPLSYCYINTLPGGEAPLVPCKDPVIVHHQISRKLRKHIRP